MKPFKRPIIATVLAVLIFAAVLTAPADSAVAFPTDI
jgi:hypothetical protein